MSIADGRLEDLTRWNRAGLKRFRYVDGDAATWLEELRVALLGLYLETDEIDYRRPDMWRHFFQRPDIFGRDADPVQKDQALNKVRDLFAASLKWGDLALPLPDKLETSRQRSSRLLAAYDKGRQDHGREIMRAFARAAHVLLGHADAYANEGYLRTATQWENVRRLAAMVNYQPTPPASATTNIALIVEDDATSVEIARGLAVKHTPPEGGAPLIFETLGAVTVHPDLNCARAEGWNRNGALLPTAKPGVWLVPDKVSLAQGDLMVLVNGKSGTAVSLKSVERDEAALTARLGFSAALPSGIEIADAELHTGPADVMTGLAKSKSGVSVAIKAQNLAQFSNGILVEFQDQNKKTKGYGQVIGIADGVINIATDVEIGTGYQVAAMSPVDKTTIDGSNYIQSAVEENVVIRQGNSFQDKALGEETVKGEFLAYRYKLPAGINRGYFHPPAGMFQEFQALDLWPDIIIVKPDKATKIVQFPGKPPKGMEAGDWFAARRGSTLTALCVKGVTTASDSFYIEFDGEVAQPDKTEFFGPMRHILHVEDHDRNPASVVEGGKVRIAGLTEAARNLVKAGRKVLIDQARDGKIASAEAEIASAEPTGGGLLLLGLKSKTSLGAFKKGWTCFRFNTVAVSHGETKGSKTLGSGDAEQRRQVFDFDIKKISFVPSTTAEAGVAPDLDVMVNDQIWSWADFGDYSAEGTRSYSTSLTETGGLKIHFRQRLPSGLNNVRVARHRIGVGLKGTGIPPFSFTKPMKKSRYVKATVQPAATAGGADMEPVSSAREQAPGRLVANDRAVSLHDFETLTARHTSVWQAVARQTAGSGAVPAIRITVVPANGGALASIEDDLEAYIKARSLPGAAFSLENYEDLKIAIGATIRVDTGAFDRTNVEAAAIAAVEADFALRQRGIGQTMFIAEIMASIEAVTGVETVTVQTFEPIGGVPARIAVISGSNAAIVPTRKQVAWAAKVAITAEAI